MSDDSNFTIPPLFTLAFEDNFDDIGQQPNSEHWTYDIGTGDWVGEMARISTIPIRPTIRASSTS